MVARGQGLRRHAGLKGIAVTELDPRLAGALRPRHVAVIGATEDSNRVGGRPLHYLRKFGFAGDVYPVNPKRDTVQGYKAYPSLDAVPQTPDVAVVAVGSDHVPDVIRQCAARGVRSAVLMSSGFGETGPAGMQRQRELFAQARSLGVRLVGHHPLLVGRDPLRLGATAIDPGGAHRRLHPVPRGRPHRGHARGLGAARIRPPAARSGRRLNSRLVAGLGRALAQCPEPGPAA